MTCYLPTGFNGMGSDTVLDAEDPFYFIPGNDDPANYDVQDIITDGRDVVGIYYTADTRKM